MILQAQEHVLQGPGGPHATKPPSDTATETCNLRRWAAGVDGRDRSAAAAAAAAYGTIFCRYHRCRILHELAARKSGTHRWDCAPNSACTVLAIVTSILSHVSVCMSAPARLSREGYEKDTGSIAADQSKTAPGEVN